MTLTLNRRQALTIPLLGMVGALAACTPSPDAPPATGPLPTLADKPTWQVKLPAKTTIADHHPRLGTLTYRPDGKGTRLAATNPSGQAGWNAHVSRKITGAQWITAANIDLIAATSGDMIWVWDATSTRPTLQAEGQATFTGTGLTLNAGSSTLFLALQGDTPVLEQPELTEGSTLLAVSITRTILTHAGDGQIMLGQVTLQDTGSGDIQAAAITEQFTAATWADKTTIWDSRTGKTLHTGKSGELQPRPVGGETWVTWGLLAWQTSGDPTTLPAPATAIIQDTAYTQNKSQATLIGLPAGKELTKGNTTVVGANLAGTHLTVTDGTTLAAYQVRATSTPTPTAKAA